jgi:hypothetical protein
LRAARPPKDEFAAANVLCSTVRRNLFCSGGYLLSLPAVVGERFQSVSRNPKSQFFALLF